MTLLLVLLLQDELRSMSRQEWMERFGGVLQSEKWFETKSPAWNYDQNSWWVLQAPAVQTGACEWGSATGSTLPSFRWHKAVAA